MKEQILTLKSEQPELGYKSIARIVGCSPNLVKYHLNPSIKEQYHNRQSQNRAIQLHSLKRELGGECKICKYNRCFDALVFHHVNPSEKEDQVPVILRKFGIEKAKEEAKKCVLLCARCHIELHSGLIKLELSAGLAPA